MMKVVRWIIGALIAVPAALIAVSKFMDSSADPMPPIIQGATATGGEYGCPKRADEPADKHNLAVSPELTSRLRKMFPTGSDPATLEAAMTKQGFQLGGSCPKDPSVRTLYFAGKDAWQAETRAEIHYKVDSDRIVWTRGFVFYTSF